MKEQADQFELQIKGKPFAMSACSHAAFVDSFLSQN
jgi:hypothetical protein